MKSRSVMARGVVIGLGGQGEATDQDVETCRCWGVVTVVGQVGLVDDAADLFERAATAAWR